MNVDGPHCNLATVSDLHIDSTACLDPNLMRLRTLFGGDATPGKSVSIQAWRDQSYTLYLPLIRSTENSVPQVFHWELQVNH